MPIATRIASASAAERASEPQAGSLTRLLGANLAVWGLICTLGAAGNYRDELRRGYSPELLHIWGAWLNMHLPLFVLSVALLYLLPRQRELGGRSIALLYGLLALLFFPLHMLYISLPGWFRQGGASSLPAYVLQRENFTFFLEFAWFSGTYAVSVAIHIWRLGQQRAAELQASREANLALALALEQQRLRGMRQQLEPHFIFNALNSISALVRASEQEVALDGIASLSALLRYALKASEQDLVRLQEELDFCRDYLDLQQLRYGARLQVHLEPVDPRCEQAEIPPLLLQPLIENALRHDLDRHAGTTDLRLRLQCERERLQISVWNSLGVRGAANPGLGLGLKQARERLALMYGERASLTIEEGANSFEVRLELPTRARDE